MPRWLYFLLLAVPLALIASVVGLSTTMVFILSAIGLIPLAGLISFATETLAGYIGERIGGLLNATFGNAAELIVGLIAISANLPDVVRASITGSIIGNALLVLGSSMLLGGWRFGTQTFDRGSAGQYASLLALAVVGLTLPSLAATVDASTSSGQQRVTGLPLHELSLVVAVILLLSYVAYIAYAIFGVRAYRREDEGAIAINEEQEADPVETLVQLGKEEEPRGVPDIHEEHPRSSDIKKALRTADGFDEKLAALWRTSPWVPLIVLAVTTAFTALLAESLVGTIEPLAHSVGLSPFFVGLIVLPIIGNAAEHTSAITMAINDRMEAAMAITAGSSIQVALLVAPVLVLLGPLLGHPLDLDFSGLELVIFALIALLYALVSLDGESTWLEGLQLLAFYLIVAVVAFFIPR